VKRLCPRMLLLLPVVVLPAGGCAGPRHRTDELAVRDAIARYAARAPGDVADLDVAGERLAAAAPPAVARTWRQAATPGQRASLPTFTLGMMDQPATSAPAKATAEPRLTGAGLPEGYWRKDVWHQMGHEALALGRHDFWRGMKTSFWDLDNALLLTVTMGASVAIRGTDVDDTVRRRIHRHQQLGDFDEPIQILGNPGTHFAATGVLWLSSTLMKDAKQHEVAKALTQALAVTGASTLLLKVAANTRAPDNEPFAWPSGHTSSSFTVAAVLNEYYGPWVGVPSFALAGLVGYQRLDSRVHDFSDVVFGAMLGYVVGTSIARDQKARFPEIWGMQVLPFNDPETGAAGLALYKSW